MRLTVMMYVRYPLSLRQVEDLLFERGIDIWHETVRLWWHRFGPIFCRGVAAKLVLANTPAALDRTLLKTVALGWAWFEEIKAGSSMQAIADREGVTQRRVAHLADLAFLAPDIIRSIVGGCQPPTLTADRLIKSRHRTPWSDQRAWIAAL
jgi:hypothetical protein